MRTTLALPAVAAAVLATTAVPAAAAPPERSVDLISAEVEADLEAVFSAACGVDVSVEGTGHVISKVFRNRSGTVVREQVTYATRFLVTNTETGATYRLVDAGPDRVLYENGEPVTLQMIGRSTTGSGVIGRTIIDLTGQRPPQSTGKVFGDFVQNTCEAIT